MNVFAGDIGEKYATLWPTEVIHAIKVLRKRMGDQLTVCNGKGATIEGKIIEIGKNEVLVSIEKKIALPSLVTGLHIAMAPTKNMARFEFFIEKASELGVSEITPILTFHSERKNIRQDKLQKKAVSASTQSLRSEFLKIHEMQTFEQFVETYSQHNLHIAHCVESLQRTPMSTIALQEKAIVMIGPEGDFSLPEITELLELPNSQSISLGPNRLRTETAGIFVATQAYQRRIS